MKFMIWSQLVSPSVSVAVSVSLARSLSLSLAVCLSLSLSVPLSLSVSPSSRLISLSDAVGFSIALRTNLHAETSYWLCENIRDWLNPAMTNIDEVTSTSGDSWFEALPVPSLWPRLVFSLFMPDPELCFRRFRYLTLSAWCTKSEKFAGIHKGCLRELSARVFLEGLLRLRLLVLQCLARA